MTNETRLSFEDALARLEESVKKLRSGECGLEESIKIYQDSVRYYELCDTILKEARQKIEIYRPETGETEVFDDN